MQPRHADGLVQLPDGSLWLEVANCSGGYDSEAWPHGWNAAHPSAPRWLSGKHDHAAGRYPRGFFGAPMVANVPCSGSVQPLVRYLVTAAAAAAARALDATRAVGTASWQLAPPVGGVAAARHLK